MMRVENPVNAWIVDDDNVYIYGFKKLISLKSLNANISSFRNGSEAIIHLKNLEHTPILPDVIFLDINMPHMDGWEFIQQFAEIKSRLGKSITVYMISSSIDLNDIYRAKNIPEIADYLFKPVTEEQLNEIFTTVQSRILKHGA